MSEDALLDWASSVAGTSPPKDDVLDWAHSVASVKPQTEDDLRRMIQGSMEPKGFWQTYAENTIPGVIGRGINRLAVGEGYVEQTPGDFGRFGNAGVGALSMIADPTNLLLAGGAKAVSEAAVRTFGKQAVGRAIGEKVLPTAIVKGTQAAAFLAQHTAVSDPLQQYIATGTVNPDQTADRVAKSALVGFALGPAASIAKPLPRIAGEIGTFTLAQPASEGRLPTIDDFIGAATTVLGFNAAGKVLELSAKIKRSPKADPLKLADGVFGKEGTDKILTKLMTDFTAKPVDVAAAAEAKTFDVTGTMKPEEQAAFIRSQGGETIPPTEIRDAKGQVSDVRGVEGNRPEQEVGRQDNELLGPLGAALPPEEAQGQTQAGEGQGAAVLGKKPSFRKFLEARGAYPIKRTDSRFPTLKAEYDNIDRLESDVDQLGAVANSFAMRAAVGRGQRPSTFADILPDDPEMARRITNAYEPRQKNWLREFVEPIRDAWRAISRPRKEIPYTGKFGSVNDILRRFEGQDGHVTQAAVEAIAGWLKPLANDYDIKLFAFKINANDQVAGLRAKEGPQKLGYGADAKKLDAWQAKLDIAIAKNPRVQAALALRTAGVKKIVDALVANGAPAEWAKNAEHYYHREIAKYRDIVQAGQRSRAFKETKKGFMRKRTLAEKPGVSEDESYDPNANYIESESAWLRDALETLDTAKLVEQMQKVADVLPRLKAEAKAAGKEWRDIIPKGHVRFVPPPGHTLFKTFSVSERIAAAIEKGTYQQLNLKPSDVREVVALGKPQFEWVIPEELARHLDAMTRKAPEGAVGRMFNRVNQMWKQWNTTISPKRTGGYFASNAVGDIEPIIAVIPSALRPGNLATTWREMWRHRVRKEPMSPTLRRQGELQVTGTGQIETEVESLGKNRDFAHLIPRRFSLTKLPRRSLELYTDFLKSIHMFAEDFRRSAVDREFLRKMKAGEPFSYGGSRPEVIDAIRRELGDEYASAKLTSDLVGNYQDRSAPVQWSSRYLMPFARWTDINLRREPRIVSNLMREAYEQGGVKRAAAAGGIQAVRQTARAGIKTGLLAAEAAAFFSGVYTATWLWNNTLFRKEEDGLSEDDRTRPHLIIGTRSDGSPVVLRNLGALGAFLDFTGLQKLATLLPLYLEKKINGERLVKDVGWDVVNNAVSMVGPYYKLPVELATQKSYFPDVRHPREATTGELITGTLGLADEYKEIKGRVFNTGERARSGRFFSPFPAGTDARRSALGDAYAWRNRFLETIGRSNEGSYPRSAFKTIRESAANDDYEAFKEARLLYLRGEKPRTYEDFARHLDRMDPLDAALSDKDERKFINEYLRPDQVERVREARDYAFELKHRLWWWYKQAVEEQDDPNQKLLYERDVRKEKKRLRETLRQRLERQVPETTGHYRERAQAALTQREKAKKELQMMQP